MRWGGGGRRNKSARPLSMNFLLPAVRESFRLLSFLPGDHMMRRARDLLFVGTGTRSR